MSKLPPKPKGSMPLVRRTLLAGTLGVACGGPQHGPPPQVAPEPPREEPVRAVDAGPAYPDEPVPDDRVPPQVEPDPREVEPLGEDDRRHEAPQVAPRDPPPQVAPREDAAVGPVPPQVARRKKKIPPQVARRKKKIPPQVRRPELDEEMPVPPQVAPRE